MEPGWPGHHWADTKPYAFSMLFEQARYKWGDNAPDALSAPVGERHVRGVSGLTRDGRDQDVRAGIPE